MRSASAVEFMREVVRCRRRRRRARVLRAQASLDALKGVERPVGRERVDGELKRDLEMLGGTAGLK